MKKLDLYIIKKFLGTFFFMITLLMAISIVFDISERLDDFLDNNAPVDEIIFKYYVNFVIYYANLFSALLIFISVVLFTAKMAQNTEIVAILSSGVSFKRFLFPYFIASTVLVSVSLYLNHYVLPEANVVRLAFEEDYLRNTYSYKKRNIHREIAPGTIIYFYKYSARDNIANEFALEKWDEGAMTYKITARVARWDTVGLTWQLDDYFVRDFREMTENIRSGARLDTVLGFTPSDLDFSKRINSASSMNYAELNAYIEAETKKGSDKVVHYLIEKHQRTSYPFATYVLTLIGVSISSRKVRGGIGLHIAFGFLTAMSYMFCMKMTTVAATNAGLEPFIAVWLPNVLFLILGLIIYKRAPK